VKATILKNRGLPRENACWPYRTLGPSKRNSKKTGRFEPSKIGVLLCLHVFEIHHSDAPNRLSLWEMASSLLSGMKRVSIYIVLIQSTT